MYYTFRRKRGERGESTAQDLIVLELTQKRVEELREIIKGEKESNKLIEGEIERIKSDKVTEEFLDSIRERMKREEKDKEREEEEHKKWLVEREAKMQQLKANRHQLLVAKPATRPKQSNQLTTTSESESKKLESPCPSEKAPEAEPLTVKIEISEMSDHQAPSNRQKISPPLSTPSTSPLLTSLLQSPSPSAAGSNPYCNKLSPAAIRDMQQRISPSHSQIYQGTPNASPPKQPSTPTSTHHPDLSFVEPHPPSCRDSHNHQSGDSSPPHMAASSPTLSKLLESASPSSIKLSISAYEPPEAESDDKRPIETSNEPRTLQNVDLSKTENKPEGASSPIEPTSIETRRQSNKDNATTRRSDSMDAALANMKQETPQSKEPNTVEALIDVKIKYEDKTEDSQQSITAEKSEDSNTLSTPSRPKRKRPATPVTPLPAATRRSGRVRANKDRKNSSEDEPTPVQTPEPSQLGAKKVTNLSVAPESIPISEESSDNTVISVSNNLSAPATPVPSNKSVSGKALSTSDSAPLTAPSTPPSLEEIESQKNYKMWKKSIMLIWRQAATHKYSSLFLQPVTDSEAKGYSTVVYKPMDLASIKKRIESGHLRTTAEFQRDIMLMFQNAIMYNSVDHEVHQMAVEMQKEILERIEDFIETQQESNTTNDTPSASTKPRGRRSTVSTSSAEAPQVSKKMLTKSKHL